MRMVEILVAAGIAAVTSYGVTKLREKEIREKTDDLEEKMEESMGLWIDMRKDMGDMSLQPDRIKEIAQKAAEDAVAAHADDSKKLIEEAYKAGIEDAAKEAKPKPVKKSGRKKPDQKSEVEKEEG